MTLNDVIQWAYVQLAGNGAPRKYAEGRRYDIGTTAMRIPLPLYNNERPHLINIESISTSDTLYCATDGTPARVPTTSTSGSERLPRGKANMLMTRHTPAISLVTNSGTVTVFISYIWI